MRALAGFAILGLTLLVEACMSAVVDPDTTVRLQPVLGRDQQVRIASRAFKPVTRMGDCVLKSWDDSNVYEIQLPAEFWAEFGYEGEAGPSEPEPPAPCDALEATILRVVDARDGKELSGVAIPVVRPDLRWRHGLESVRWELRDASSPIELRDLFLDPLQRRMLRLEIGAKGFVQQEFEIDLLQGGVQTVELEPEALLRVVVQGIEGEPPYFLRVYGAELPWQRKWTQLDHDGWLDVEGLPPGPARVEVIWSDAAGLHVAASTTLTLSCDSPERVEFTLPRRPPSDVGLKDERVRFLPTRRQRYPSASVHLRCGTRVLHAPIGFEVQGSPGLRDCEVLLDGVAVESDTASLFELHPPQIPGFVGPASVLIELRARESLDYVIEYERLPEGDGPTLR